MNILSIHTQPFLKFSFSILKKDEIYKVMIETIETQKNKTLILKIFDLKDNLLLTFDRMLMKISIYNQTNENFIVPLKFNFSNIDRNLDNFLIDTIVFKNEDSETKIISYDYNKQITLTLKSYTFHKYFHESINEPLKIFYYFVFKNKFPNTKISLEKFLESPKSIYELEKIISY